MVWVWTLSFGLSASIAATASAIDIPSLMPTTSMTAVGACAKAAPFEIKTATGNANKPPMRGRFMLGSL